MTDAVLAVAPAPTFNEDTIAAALTEARGDIFIASQALAVTALRLDRAIRLSDRLRAVAASIRETKADPEYDKLTQQDFESAVVRRLAMYRVVGLDALADLASMAIGDNSAQNQVKLAAAARLAGATGDAGGADMAGLMRELNEAYEKDAPRIRLTRTEIEIGPGERVVDTQKSPG